MTDEVLGLGRRMVEQDIPERKDQMELDIRQVMATAITTGNFRSGSTYGQLRELLERQVDIQATSVWRIFARIFADTSTPISAEDGAKLKGIIRDYTSQTVEEVTERIEKLDEQYRPGVQPIGDLSAKILAKLDAEIDLAVMHSSSQEKKGIQNFHFYHSVGMVQAGAGSTGTVNISESSEAIATLNRALDMIQEQLIQQPMIGATPSGELKAVVEEIRTEIQAETPNSTKLRGYLVGLATTIQATAGMNPAYQLLKGAAASFGVTLP